MKVFLSSTHIDLVDYRRRATDAINRLDQQVGQMEVFGARPEGALPASLGEVEACDLFVGVYAHRYGYQPTGSDISITEAEFRHAKSLEKPIFCFIVKEDQPWPDKMIEEEPGRTKLRALKAEIETSLVREEFTTPEDLALKIATALARYINRTFASLVEQLKRLMEQNANASAQERQAITDALSAAVEIANRTLQYLRRNPSERDSDEENELSQGWEAAGFKLLALPTPATDLAERYFLKSKYWSYPELWTAKRVNDARIRLDEIADESRAFLLGQFRRQPSAGGTPP